MLVGCDKPLMTVFTERFGSVIPGPLDGEFTVVCRLTELSVASGSFSAAATFAVLVSTPAACGTTMMLMIALALRASDPRLHVTVVLRRHEEPCGGVAEMKLIPAGKL